MVLTSHAVMAGAQAGDDERARMHFELARSHYQDGAYDRALDEFRRAYELSGREELLINLANCNERLGRHRAAVANLRAFLETDPIGPERAQIERRIANLERFIAEEAEVEEERATEMPSAEPSGAVSMAPESGEADLGAGVDADSATDGEASDPPAGKRRVGSVVGFSVGAVGVIMAATLGGMALHEQNALESSCGITRSCTDAQVDRVDRLALAADVGIGVAVAGAVTGVVFLLVADRDEDVRDGAVGGRARVAPYVGPTGAGATAMVRF